MKRTVLQSLVLIGCLAGLPVYAAEKYRVLEGKVLHGSSVNPHGLNIRGEVAGASGLSHGGDLASFVWTSGAGAQGLQRANNSDYAEAMAINDDGVMVGTMNTPTSMHGFRWS